jgi:hypothetical protein
MFRVVLAIVFFVTSSGLILASLFSGADPSIQEVFGNLGTEVFGILVTIALVDWYLEKRRRQDRAKELAWGVLHGIEHAVWIWQGGPRHLGTSELLGIISGIRRQNTLEPFTEGLFLNVGLQSRSILQREQTTVRSLPGLRGILNDLVSLASIRDLPDSTRLRTVSEILETSVIGLARTLGQSTDRMPSGLIWYQDATSEAQESRYKQALSTTLGELPGAGSPGGGLAFPYRDPLPEPEGGS